MHFYACKHQNYKKNKIVYINSYHRGHPSCDEIIDAKRNSDPDYIENREAQLYDSILEAKPDTSKLAGMFEILPLADVLLTIRSNYPSMKKLLVLTENTTTSRKEKQLLDTLYNRVGVSVSHELVNDFDQWKSVFKEANNT